MRRKHRYSAHEERNQKLPEASDTGRLSALEEKFDKFDEEVKPLLLSFPDPNLSHDKFEEAVRHFRVRMLSLRGVTVWAGTNSFIDCNR